MTHPQPTGAFEWTQAPWGHVLRCRPLLDVAEHFFTDASLELRESVEEWRGVAALAGVERESLLLLRQVHGSGVAVAGATRQGQWGPPEADAVVSDDPASALVVRVADCAPILLADSQRRAVAAIHAGWRSTMQRIVMAAVEALQREFGSAPADLVAAIGPSLGPCCGEMGAEVVDGFRAAGHSARDVDRWFERRRRERPHFDLWGANRDQLESAGVPHASIHVAGLCTRTHDRVFHSYRAQGPSAGRMIGVIRSTRERMSGPPHRSASASNG